MEKTTEKTTPEFVTETVRLCEDKKAEDVMAYDLRGVSVLIDYCIICTSNNDAQTRAIVHHLEKELKNRGLTPRNVEGTPESQWVILDYYDILIHVFQEKMRRRYAIEDLLEAGRLIYPDGMIEPPVD